MDDSGGRSARVGVSYDDRPGVRKPCKFRGGLASLVSEDREHRRDDPLRLVDADAAVRGRRFERRVGMHQRYDAESREKTNRNLLMSGQHR